MKLKRKKKQKRTANEASERWKREGKITLGEGESSLNFLNIVALNPYLFSLWSIYLFDLCHSRGIS